MGDAETKAKADESKVKAPKETKAKADESKVLNLCDAPADVCKRVAELFPGVTVEIVMVGKTRAGINLASPDGKKEFHKVSI